MGLLSWWRGSPKPANPNPSPSPKEAPGMNGAVEVLRPPTKDVSVFEFGSAADKVTLAGYCPVSDDLEPCRWQIVSSSGDDAPMFRIVF